MPEAQEKFLMASLYWIRRKEHKDIWSEGYIGITKQTVAIRFKSHINSFKAGRKGCDKLQAAFGKYGYENLIVETILDGVSLDFVAEMEKTLRPYPEIGWNIAVGGYAKQLGRKFSKEHRKKLSESHSGKIISEEQKEYARKRVTELWEDAEYRDIQTKNRSKWRPPFANKRIWANAGMYFNFWVKDNPTGITIAKHFDEYEFKNVIRGIVRHFKEGWIPYEDEEWVTFFNEYEDEK